MKSPPMFLLLLLPLACVESEETGLDVEVPGDSSATTLDTGGEVEVVPGIDSSDLPPVAYPLLINELCASNRNVLLDPLGDTPDWIELINPHDFPFELEGFGLSDDPDDPFVWELPVETLGPGQVLLFYASGRDLASHTSFKLDALGETLTLTAPDRRIHDQVETGRLYTDQSYGRGLEDLEWLHFIDPTPGALNETEGRPGFAEMPVIGPDGGFHWDSITVEMSSTSDAATIHYHLGPEIPGEEAPVYSEPVQIDAFEATVVRAIAVEEGLWPSRVATRTLFLNRPIDMPVWSITSKPMDLFSPESGIMHPRNIYENWEVDTHLEFYEADGSLILASDAGLKLHGGATRTSAQKGMRLLFRSGYGTAPFEHMVFPDNPVTEFHRLILRNGGHDDGLSELRDPLSHQLVRDLDVDVQAWRPAAVYLNGDYWGMYNTREKQDRYYVESHHGVDPDDLDFLEYDGNIINEGDNQDYQDLWVYVLSNNMADPDHYAVIRDWIEVEEYILYQVIEIFSGNYDWPGNNIQFWRPRADEGRWRWTLYDTEAGWNNWISPSYNSIAHATMAGKSWWPYPDWSTSLFRGLLDNPEFRHQFINTFADLLNTRFDPVQSVPILDGMMDMIAGEIASDQERWGGSLSGWVGQVDSVRSFLEERPGYTRDHIVFEFGLPGTWDLDLDVDPPGAGQVDLEVFSVEGPFTGTYFLDVPVELTAVPAEGWVFVEWSDPALGSNAEIVIDPNEDQSLVARFELAE